jgi:hypothetical protein
MCWRCGSSGRVPTLQTQSPDFKPQSHQKKKEIKVLIPIFLNSSRKLKGILPNLFYEASMAMISEKILQ